jgi:single-strand DNA-binding protein
VTSVDLFNVAKVRTGSLRRSPVAGTQQPVIDLESKEGRNTRRCWSCLPLTTTTMNSVNKLILVGHVAADPDRAEMKSGKVRVVFPVATHRDSTSEGVKKEVTDYHRVVAWGKLGEECLAHLSKGQGVYVEGAILNRAYEKDGERRYITEIRADEVNTLTWTKKSGTGTVSIDPFGVE